MPYEPFPYEGLSTSGSSEGGFAKIGPFFSFFYLFFSSGPCPFFSFFFWGRLWAGPLFWEGEGRGVVVLPGWLHMPLQGYYQIILVVNGR